MEKPPLPGSPAQPDEQRLVLLGLISKPQGLKGALRLLPQFDDWTDFARLKTDRVFLKPDPSGDGLRPRKAEYRKATIVDSAAHRKFLVVNFSEAPDVDSAELFRGMLAYVYENELWDLPDGKYYAFQLEGLEVYDSAEEAVIGTVKALRTGVQDHLVVAGPEKEFLIPYVPEMVKDISLKTNRVTVDLPPGLDEI